MTITTTSHSITIPLQMQSEVLHYINYKEKQICFSVMLKGQKMEKGTKTTDPVVDVTMRYLPQNDSSLQQVQLHLAMQFRGDPALR